MDKIKEYLYVINPSMFYMRILSRQISRKMRILFMSDLKKWSMILNGNQLFFSLRSFQGTSAKFVIFSIYVRYLNNTV